MRLILSRKGFDSSYGGCPSPVLPDGTLVSFPIPEEGGSRSYAELACSSGSVGTLLSELTNGRLGPANRAHLDPDLDRNVCSRGKNWVPAFGQAGAAARHLDGEGVGAGDLFLFFGWFRETERFNGKLRFARNAPHLHVIFGWLRVGSIHREPLRGIERHPHFLRPYDFSRVYAASSAGDGGVFRTYSPSLQLTRPGGANRSEWSLPGDFLPAGRTPLTYHSSPSRWKRYGERALLRVVARGQEFVLPTEQYPHVRTWATRICKDVS